MFEFVNESGKFSSIKINIKYFCVQIHMNWYSDVFNCDIADLKSFIYDLSLR